MFICDQCKKVSQPKEKPHKVVIETRIREIDGGEEIVKEINQCESCFDSNKTVISKHKNRKSDDLLRIFFYERCVERGIIEEYDQNKLFEEFKSFRREGFKT